ERLDQRQSQVQAFLELPLMERVAAPAQAPNLAVVSMDGGRIQILDRQAPGAEPSDPGVGSRPTPASPPEPPEDEDEADQDPHRHGHWREDKIGLLMTMTSEESSEDPCPQIPETFVNPLKIPKMVREIKRSVRVGEDGVAEAVADAPASELEECPEYTPPQVRVKSMVG